MITTCIRVLGSLPVNMKHERNIDIMVSSRSDANLLTSDWIPSLTTTLLFWSPLTICLSSCTLITLWPGTVPNAFTSWSRLSVEPKEFAIALKLSFYRFAILFFPEVPPSGSGKDSFLGLIALISFHSVSIVYSTCRRQVIMCPSYTAHADGRS